MKKYILLLLMFFSSMMASAQVEKIIGEWRTVDDVTGETKGIVEFYKGDNGLYYGKIIKIGYVLCTLKRVLLWYIQ